MSAPFVLLGLFGVTVLAGLVMAFGAFRRRAAPSVVAVVHFLFATVAVMVLARAALGPGGSETPLLKTALLIIGVAALGGFFLGAYRFGDRPPPLAFVAGHGLLGLAGAAVLAVALLG